MDESGWTKCAVTAPDRTVIGFVQGEKIQDVDEAVPIEEVMQLGPTTFRFDTSLERATEFMDTKEVDCILLTSSEGKLLGLLHQNYADKTLADTGRVVQN